MIGKPNRLPLLLLVLLTAGAIRQGEVTNVQTTHTKQHEEQTQIHPRDAEVVRLPPKLAQEMEAVVRRAQQGQVPETSEQGLRIEAQVERAEFGEGDGATQATQDAASVGTDGEQESQGMPSPWHRFLHDLAGEDVAADADAETDLEANAGQSDDDGLLTSFLQVDGVGDWLAVKLGYADRGRRKPMDLKKKTETQLDAKFYYSDSTCVVCQFMIQSAHASLVEFTLADQAPVNPLMPVNPMPVSVAAGSALPTHGAHVAAAKDDSDSKSDEAPAVTPPAVSALPTQGAQLAAAQDHDSDYKSDEALVEEAASRRVHSRHDKRHREHRTKARKRTKHGEEPPKMTWYDEPKKYRALDLLRDRPPEARNSMLGPLLPSAQSEFDAATFKTNWLKTYRVFAQTCATRVPTRFALECTFIARSFRWVVEGLRYGDRADQVCNRLGMCDDKSYIALGSHKSAAHTARASDIP